MHELYIDFCDVLEERGLLHIEMDNDYLPGFVETYWDHFSDDLEASECDNLNLEPQKLSDNERWHNYLFARIENRIVGFECTNCIISKTHPILKWRVIGGRG